MATCKKLVLGILVLFGLGAMRVDVSAQQNNTSQKTPIVIVAEVVKGRITYEVDSKPALPDLLYVLNAKHHQCGNDCAVVALVDIHARMSEIGNIDGVAGKAQLTNLHFFIFDREGQIMNTFQFGPTIPFTTHPAIQ